MRLRGAFGFTLAVLGFSTVLILGQQHGATHSRGPAKNTTQTALSQLCSQPNYPGGQTAIDSVCGSAGSGGAEAAQSTAKNNFCASGPANPITISDMVARQNQVQAAKKHSFR